MFPPCLVPFPRALPTPSKPVSPVLPLCPHQLPVLPLPPSPSPPCPCSGKVLESFELRSESPRTETIAQRWSPAERGGPGAAIGASLPLHLGFSFSAGCGDLAGTGGWAGLCSPPRGGAGGVCPASLPLAAAVCKGESRQPGHRETLPREPWEGPISSHQLPVELRAMLSSLKGLGFRWG